MVCAKCAKLQKPTSLATPGVKAKSEQYHGSIQSTTKSSAGIGKSKLLSRSAKNPYAAYSASCEKCKVKVDQGKRYCQRCAYKENACTMCGKSLTKSGDTAGAVDGNLVQGQRFSTK